MSERRPYVDDSEAVEKDSPSAPQQPYTIDEKKDIVSGHIQEHDNQAVEELVEKFGDREDGIAPMADIEHVMTKIESLSVDECKCLIQDLLSYHEYDYNFSILERAKLQKLLEGPADGQSLDEWELEVKTETAINKFYSPYPEVRAVSDPHDDVNTPCETIRAHLLGYIWAIIAQFTNSLFNSRFPNITLSSAVAQILLYPCGMLLAKILPDWGFTFRGKRVSLNPGPWTYKEQMLSTIIVDVGLTSAYCFWNIQVQTVYYKDTWLTPGYGILLLLSTQLMGLGFSGLLRRFVVYPVETLWPSILPTLALNRALLVPERKETIHGWSISRYRFFFYVFSAMFIYFWLPGFLFPALSYFAWMTWIKPNNFNLNIITGNQAGLGFNPIPTFDWNIISYLSQPLAYPFFSFAQQFTGTFLGGLIIIALYYTNTKGAAYMPINSSAIFDNHGQRYNITRVLHPHSAVLNETAYQEYSPAFYGAGNMVVYGSFFTFYPLTMVFILLDAWRPLLRAYRSMLTSFISAIRSAVLGIKGAVSCLFQGKLREAGSHIANMMGSDGSIYDGFDDPFTNMLRNYPEVPDWWFLMVALVAFIFSIVVLTNWPQLDTPVWTIFFVIGLNLVFLIPMSYLYSISGSTQGLNVITELVVGYALPGRPEALMFVKAFGYNINGQADTYISDQKMGFYAKVPPRAMYRGQITSSIITALVAYGVVQFADTQIENICSPDQAQHFTCASGSQVFFSASVVWGAIGPKRIFSQIYPELKYCFLLGFLLALVWWTLKRSGGRARNMLERVLPSAIFKPLNIAIFTPVSWLKHVHPSLIVNGMISWAPWNLSYYTSGLYVSITFMYYMKRYKLAWWEKYNYVMSAALTGGMAFSAIIIFFAVQYHPIELNWWGANIIDKTIDGGGGTQQALYTQLPEKGYFGPDKWY